MSQVLRTQALGCLYGLSNRIYTPGRKSLFVITIPKLNMRKLRLSDVKSLA